MERRLELVEKQNIAILGDDQVFVRRTPGGLIRSVKGAPTLKESHGEFAVIQGKAMTTSKGFNTLNQIAGLSIITPATLQLPNGDIVVNPYPIIDEESHTITKVWCKKIAIGYSPIGNLVITSATLLYDIRMYFIQDVMKKVQFNQGSGKVCMEQMLTEKEKQTGVFLKIDGTFGVWADFTHKEILKAVETFINKKQFAERNAQSICERLAMSKHPALSHAAYVDCQGPEKQRVTKVQVIGYVHEFSKEQLMAVAEQAERGEDIVVNGKKAETISMTAEATEADFVAEADDEERAGNAEAEVIHAGGPASSSQSNGFEGGERF
ncbi:hypothetical protein FE783_12830 [Paenibacillus mesophilus]|uniref:hypothetical protein n=1 Tax=Paenibacillus mesophilus TaxID=2582849 RepID=UPI00110D5418|nr:hypothetical protein [Paenibacillus mesophilus]TMV49392.1 hypothetical protein FE783_12830 [Paenibacillus mesophilus]